MEAKFTFSSSAIATRGPRAITCKDGSTSLAPFRGRRRTGPECDGTRRRWNPRLNPLVAETEATGRCRATDLQQHCSGVVACELGGGPIDRLGENLRLCSTRWAPSGSQDWRICSGCVFSSAGLGDVGPTTRLLGNLLDRPDDLAF
jgi:hypothetical protein